MELQRLQFGKIGNAALQESAHQFGLADWADLVGDVAQNKGASYIGKDSGAASKYLNDAGDWYARAGKHERLSRGALTSSVKAERTTAPRTQGMDY